MPPVAHLQAARVPPQEALRPPTPEAIATLRAHPHFPAAMRASAAGIVALYQGGRLLNWLMDDRGRLLFGYLALYLHFARHPDDPASGLTPTRMKQLCAEFDICSAGRATAMLSLMRFAGYLAPAAASDRRLHVLVATERLIGLLLERWRLHFAAMAPLSPEGKAAQTSLDAPAFQRDLTIAMFERFRAGFRFMTHAPELGLFGERNAGMLMLASLIAAGDADDTVPPQRPVPISVSALARRFSVSRPHVLKLLNDAAAEGFIERIGAMGERVVILPRLSEASCNFFATMYLFFAACAGEALAAAQAHSISSPR
jgi:hypothetical protein